MGLSQKECVPCKGGIEALGGARAKELLKELSSWQISEDGKWLTKSYKFKNFVQALAFVNKVGDVAEREKHHPDLTLGWGYVGVKLQTHAVGGLHENDFILAAKIDLVTAP